MSSATEIVELETFPLKSTTREVDSSLVAFDALLLSPTRACTKQRLPYIKSLLLEEVKQNTPIIHERLIPLIKQLHEDDDDEVRTAVVALLPSIAEILYTRGGDGRDSIVQFVQCSATLLSDASNYVREAALATFDDLVTFLSPSDQEHEIVPVITDLLGSEDRMDRVCGLLLLVSLIEKETALGGATHLINWLSQLLCDDDQEVRQELASLYPAFLQALPEEMILKTALPHFRFLVKDKIWGVRKAAAESLHALLEMIPEGESSKDLQSLVAEYYTILSTDPSTFVRLAVQRSLGEILVNLDPALVTDGMVDTFVSCVKESPDQSAALFMGNCAQMFTAVAVKLGARQWDQLRDLFTELTKSLDEDVLSSLATTLHELARLLPPDAFRRDVLPFLAKMMHGGSLAVRTGIAQNFACLLASLPGELQELCLYHLDHLANNEITSVQHQTSEKNSYVTFFTRGWRLRASLAQQLSQVASMLPSDLVGEYVIPHAFHLCEDSVAHVRLEAAEQIVRILYLHHQEHISMILNQVDKWQQSGSYKIRCVAAVISLRTESKRLPTDAVEHLDEIRDKLKRDPVNDVRRVFD